MNDKATYSNLLELSKRMLAAAQLGDWDELVALEKLRAEQVAALKMDEQGQSKPADAEIKTLIEAILVCDVEVRSLTERWMAESKEILSSIQATRKIQQTYR